MVYKVETGDNKSIILSIKEIKIHNMGNHIIGYDLYTHIDNGFIIDMDYVRFNLSISEYYSLYFDSRNDVVKFLRNEKINSLLYDI
jgi:hypothetical protein